MSSEDPIYYNSNGDPLPWEAEAAAKEKKNGERDALLAKRGRKWTKETMVARLLELAKEAKVKEAADFDKFAEAHDNGTLQETLV